MIFAKNVLVFIPNDSRAGGSDEVLFQIAKHYAEKGANVYVLFLTRMRFGDWSELEKLPNVHFYHNNSGRELGGVIPSLRNVFRLQHINFDYVYASNPHTISFLGILKITGVIKTKHFVGREMTSVFLRFSGRRLWPFRIHHSLGYRALDCLVCQSEEMKQQFIKGTPSIAKLVHPTVVPNPVNRREMDERSNQGQDFTVSFENQTIVSAGRFITEKGFDLLIEAYDKLRKDEHYGDVQLLILGDGTERETLEKIVNDKGLEGKVLMPGMSKNVYPYFKRATACVVSSRIEGFPNVLLQMMSQCNRVVSTTCAGGVDQIEGLITCQPDSSEALYHAIKQSFEMKDSSKNRELFDQELQSRNIDNFVAKIEAAVER